MSDLHRLSGGVSTLQARIFLSCGQSSGGDERAVAHQIAERLQRLGFIVYIAVEEQSLAGVKDNILRQIEASEYFVFIDFKREQLPGGDRWRGSLFSHQELAIAIYLGKDVVAFREKGVELNGIAGYIQMNAKEFGERSHLPAIVADEISSRGWSSNWRSGLSLDVDNQPPTRALRIEQTIGKVREFDAVFFHITVHNNHNSRPAVNCYAYLQSIHDVQNNTTQRLRTVELKWEGCPFPNVLILPSSRRRFDAFWCESNENFVHFNVLTDSGHFHPRSPAVGRHILQFMVVAENFPPVRRSFQLEVTDQVESFRFTECGESSSEALSRA